MNVVCLYIHWTNKRDNTAWSINFRRAWFLYFQFVLYNYAIGAAWGYVSRWLLFAIRMRSMLKSWNQAIPTRPNGSAPSLLRALYSYSARSLMLNCIHFSAPFSSTLIGITPLPCRSWFQRFASRDQGDEPVECKPAWLLRGSTRRSAHGDPPSIARAG